MSDDRRRRAVRLGWAGVVLALVLTVALGGLGAWLLSVSTVGRDAAAGVTVPHRALPVTSTALLAGVTDEGRVTTIAAILLDESGAGGSVVLVSPSADELSGGAGEARPLNAIYAGEGPEGFVQAVERMTGVSFDLVEIADADRLAELFGPLSPMAATLPIGLADTVTETVWESGQVTLNADEAASVLTAANLVVEDRYADPVRAAVWTAAVGSAGDESSAVSEEPVTTMDEVIAALTSGSAQVWELSSQPGDPTSIAPGLTGVLGAAVPSVVSHDRAEIAIVFGAAAPGRRSATIDAPTVRVVARFDDAQAGEVGARNRTVLAKPAVDALLTIPVNLVSFADLSDDGGEVPAVTRVEVADPAAIDMITALIGDHLGEVEVVAAEHPIDGVDIEIVLGEAYRDQYGAMVRP